MKKLFYTLLVAVTGFTAQAQIVLTRSDLATAGQTFNMTEDTMYTLPAGFRNTGSGKTWALDTLIDKNNFSVMKYHNASSTPDAAMYPQADLALQEDTTDPYMIYLQTSNSEIRYLGANDSMDFSSGVSFRAFIFPMQLNTTWRDTSKMTQTFTGADFGMPTFDSVKLDLTIIFDNIVDAEGSLRIPGLTTNALRLKRNVYTDVTISAKFGSFPYTPLGSQVDTSDTYEFLADNGGSWIARLEQIENDDYTVTFRDLHPLSIKKNFASAGYKVYPNPSEGLIKVDVKTGDASYKLINISGSAVMNGSLQQGTNVLDASSLAKGVYLLQVTNSQGEFFAEKIMIQ